jgi:predicted PurR-regulated permease PerM
MKIQDLEPKQNLYEMAPFILPALGMAIRIGVPAIVKLLGKTAIKYPKTTAVAGIAAAHPEEVEKTISNIQQIYNLVKDPSSIASILAKKSWSTISDAAKDISKIVQDNLSDEVIKNMAKVVITYGIPIVAVIALLYGGKKLLDYIKTSDTKSKLT